MTIIDKHGQSVPAMSAKEIGRYATRVRVRHGAYADRRGVIARISHEGSVEVRLDMGSYTLSAPFGLSELEAV